MVHCTSCRLDVVAATIYEISYGRALLFMNVMNIIAYLKLAINFNSGVVILTSIITSHFLLSLRQASNGGGDRSSDAQTAVSTVHFASRIVGDMGGQLSDSFGLDSQAADDMHDEDERGGLEESVSVEHAELVEEPDIVEVSRVETMPLSTLFV